MNFDFNIVPQIIFGRGQIGRLPQVIAHWGQAVLVVQPDHPGHEAMAERLRDLLAGSRVAFHLQGGEPTVSNVDGALAAARAHGAQVIVGLGGGSAIDCAKAVAALLTNGGQALDYMEVVGKGRKITKPAAPWVAIPTTAGTGAEATRNAVIGAPEQKFKASIRSEHMLARVALVDPELGVGVPPEVTASSGMDALCQVIEAYTSIGANPMTDALSLQGVALASRSLKRAYEDGQDIDAREDMALCALLSGITLSNAGLGAVHGFAAPMGANYPVPHGTVCAALLPHVIDANVAAMRTQQHAGLKRYADIGRTMAGDSSLAEDQAIARCIDLTQGLLRDLRIPPLSRFGLTEAGIPDMVALARKASSMRFNPVTLSDDALAEILRKAM